MKCCLGIIGGVSGHLLPCSGREREGCEWAARRCGAGPAHLSQGAVWYRGKWKEQLF